MAISRAFAILIALAVITFPMQAFKIATSTIRPYFARSSAGIARSMVSSLSKKSVTSSAMEVDTPSARVLPVLKAVRPKVLFVLGGPGAGKGTQCEMLSNEYGMKHLSAGELLREEINSGSANGKLIDGYLKEGKIVPVKITLDLLREKMETTACNRFLVDGFPRNWDNVQGWESCMTEVCDIEAVMFIDCPEEELERRLLSRGKTSGRSDDNLTTARKRFATFKESTMPVVEHYEGLKKLVRVRGDQAIDAVFRDMKAAVAPFVEGEILELTDSLLKAISNRDWDAYKNLCDPSLTAFEGEAKGNLVEGLDFHKFYFDFGEDQHTPSPSHSNNKMTETKPVVKVMGTSAVVSYVRRIGSGETFEETRVWQLFSGQWRQVHFHRGPAPSE